MTRSTSSCRPTTGSSLSAPRRRGQIDPHLVDDRRLGRSLGRLRAALGLTVAHHLHDLGPHFLEVYAQALEHAGGDALTLPHEAQQ